jgi:hypothetical protein
LTEVKVKKVNRATVGFIVSLIGGIIDVLVAIIIIAEVLWGLGLEIFIHAGEHGSYVYWTDRFASFFQFSSLTIWRNIGLVLAVEIGLVLSIVVIIGAILIYMPGKETIGGVLVLVFSIINLFFATGGLFGGLILGIIGGALGIAKKRPHI